MTLKITASKSAVKQFFQRNIPNHIIFTNRIAAAPDIEYNEYHSSQYKIHGGKTMKKYVCDVCGYIYDEELGDPDNGIAPGTKFEDLPDDWECPICSVGKEDFSEVEDE